MNMALRMEMLKPLTSVFCVKHYSSFNGVFVQSVHKIIINIYSEGSPGPSVTRTPLLSTIILYITFIYVIIKKRLNNLWIYRFY